MVQENSNIVCFYNKKCLSLWWLFIIKVCARVNIFWHIKKNYGQDTLRTLMTKKGTLRTLFMLVMQYVWTWTYNWEGLATYLIFLKTSVIRQLHLFFRDKSRNNVFRVFKLTFVMHLIQIIPLNQYKRFNLNHFKVLEH